MHYCHLRSRDMSTGPAFTDTTFSGHVSDMPKHMSDYFTFYSDKLRTLLRHVGDTLGT